MSSQDHMTMGKKMDALVLKIGDLQRDVSALREDVRQILWLLRQEKEAKESRATEREDAQS